MKFKLVEDRLSALDESIILEAKFHGEAHTQRHYEDHVLGSDEEEFVIYNPKFPAMSKQEYMDRAEQLTLADAKPIYSGEELKSARGTVGWMASDPTWKRDRAVKIVLDSPIHPGFIEIVAYTDDEDGDQIFTYMLAKRGRKYREFARKSGELPENEIVDVEETEKEENTEKTLEK